MITFVTNFFGTSNLHASYTFNKYSNFHSILFIKSYVNNFVDIRFSVFFEYPCDLISHTFPVKFVLIEMLSDSFIERVKLKRAKPFAPIDSTKRN